jgi:hypothetical protein
MVGSIRKRCHLTLVLNLEKPDKLLRIRLQFYDIPLHPGPGCHVRASAHHGVVAEKPTR